MNPPTSAVAPLEPGDPPQIGAYRLVGRLGAGGMGQVYLGVSRGGRRVAVKVLRADLDTDAEFRARFAREVAAARAVNGFYTAPVVDADPGASPPWMVTAYVQGPSLAAAVAQRGPLGESEVRDLAAALAEGLAAIHAGGLIHRDLKPANIILADDGPRIIDFGIARAVGTTTMTAKGTVIGTFTYMSPEQVMGAAIGPESDVFSLGSVLAFAATGHGPFDADTLPAITHRILAQPPDLTGLPGTLADLLMACLNKEPAQRPSLDALLTWLAEPAGGPGVLVPGHPATAAAMPAPASAFAPTPAFPAQLGPGFAAGSPPAFAAGSAAASASPSALSPSAFSPSAPPVATQDLAPAPGPPGFAAPAPSAYPSNPPLPSVLLGTGGWGISEIAFSPDGHLVAGSSAQGAYWRVFFWDASTGQPAGPPVDGQGAGAPRLAFSKDARLLILKEAASTRLLSMVTRQFVSLPASAPAEHAWKKVRFSPDGRLLVTANESRRVSGFAGALLRFWDSATLQPAGGPVKVDMVTGDSTLAFSADGRYLLSGHMSQIFLGDVTAPAPALRKLKELRGTVGRTSFSGDGRMLAAQREEGYSLRVFDTATQAPVMTLSFQRELGRVDFSPTGSLLATATAAGDGEGIVLWHLAASAGGQSWPTPTAGQYTASHLRLDGFQLPVDDLQFSPDGAFLTASSQPRSRDRQALVRIWSVSNGQPGGPLGLPGPVRMAFSPDSRFLAVGCPDQAVRLVSLRTATPVSVLPGWNAAFAPSSVRLATGEPGGLRLWTLPQ